MREDGTVAERRFLKLPAEYDSLQHKIDHIKRARHHGSRRVSNLWAYADDVNKDIVVKTMTEDFGNPSAMHMVGVKAEKYIKEAQENIAKILKVDPKEIFFTSGGTESNNMAIIGTAMANKRKGNKIITTSVEHSSVLATMKYLEEQGFELFICLLTDMALYRWKPWKKK
jgi:selenocysteine lyase/cysteine desulfurase